MVKLDSGVFRRGNSSKLLRARSSAYSIQLGRDVNMIPVFFIGLDLCLLRLLVLIRRATSWTLTGFFIANPAVCGADWTQHVHHHL